MERLLRRSHATGLRWFALSLVGLGVAAACSDDPTEPGQEPAAAGQAGENAAGAGAASVAGNAGKSAGGTATMPSSGAGGAAEGVDEVGGAGGIGGAGGEPTVATLGEQCTACAATECTDTLASCNASTECGAWLGCVTACDTAECVASCDADSPDAARVYASVYDCMCSSCKADCSAAGACEKKTCVDDNPLPVSDVAPATLAETGLYETVESAGGAGGAGGATGVELATPIRLSSVVRGFEPKYPLWADGALKDRHVYIPKCSTIDTSDMDHWKFPVGTRFWKQFTVDGKVVETRMMHRHGPAETDWVYVAYQWDVNAPADPTLAKLTGGSVVANANGTTHDIPSTGQCKLCHNSLSEKVLGFGAFQLSHTAKAGDLDIRRLSELNWLTDPAPDGFTVPGTPVQQAALGYLHGNCGGCHHQTANLPGSSPQVLRLLVGKTDYAMTDTVLTTVNIPTVNPNTDLSGKPRIDPMSPTTSTILLRMKDRATYPMPYLGTEVPDTDGGVKAVTDWIKSIPQ